MAVLRSGAYMDWTGVQFVYGATPTTVLIGEVESIDMKLGGQLKTFGGDNSPGDTHTKLTRQTRQLTLKGADIGILMSIPLGVEGTLTAKFNDENNGEGPGALTLVLSNAKVPDFSATGKHAEYAEGTIMFQGRFTKSGSNYVDPLAITQAPNT